MTNRHSDLSLERSKFAWDCANEAKIEPREDNRVVGRPRIKESTVKREPSGRFKEYVTLVKNIPTSLSNNGLGQTLAFLNSKPNSRSHRLLFKQLEKWLKSEIYRTPTGIDDLDIISLIQGGEIDQYRRAAREILELITWLKLHSSSLNVETDSNNDHKKVAPYKQLNPNESSKASKEAENTADDSTNTERYSD